MNFTSKQKTQKVGLPVLPHQKVQLLLEGKHLWKCASCIALIELAVKLISVKPNLLQARPINLQDGPAIDIFQGIAFTLIRVILLLKTEASQPWIDRPTRCR